MTHAGPSSIDKLIQHKLKHYEPDSNGSFLCSTCNFATGYIPIDGSCDGCGKKYAEVEKLCNEMHTSLTASITEFKDLKDHFAGMDQDEIDKLIEKYRDMVSTIHFSKKAKLEAVKAKYMKGANADTKKWIEFQHNQLGMLKNKAYVDIENMA